MIRIYRKEDYLLLRSWWEQSGEPIPSRDMIPKTTFILESDHPVMAISVIMTNTKIALLENFIKEPGHDNKRSGEVLVKHAENFAKTRGCKYLICLSYKDKLKQRYQDLGYTNTVNNLSSFSKKIN